MELLSNVESAENHIVARRETQGTLYKIVVQFLNFPWAACLIFA